MQRTFPVIFPLKPGWFPESLSALPPPVDESYSLRVWYVLDSGQGPLLMMIYCSFNSPVRLAVLPSFVYENLS